MKWKKKRNMKRLSCQFNTGKSQLWFSIMGIMQILQKYYQKLVLFHWIPRCSNVIGWNIQAQFFILDLLKYFFPFFVALEIRVDSMNSMDSATARIPSHIWKQPGQCLKRISIHQCMNPSKKFWQILCQWSTFSFYC